MEKVITIKEVNGALMFDIQGFTAVEVIGVMSFYKERYIRLAMDGTTTDIPREENK